MVSDDPDTATTATIATVWTALGDVSFATEGDTASATVPRLGMELGGIDEGGHATILRNPDQTETL